MGNREHLIFVAATVQHELARGLLQIASTHDDPNAEEALALLNDQWTKYFEHILSGGGK